MGYKAGARTNHLGMSVGSIDVHSLKTVDIHGTQKDPWRLISGASCQQMKFKQLVNDPKLNRKLSQIISLLQHEHDSFWDGEEVVRVYQKNSVQEVRMKGYRYLQHNGLHYKKKI